MADATSFEEFVTTRSPRLLGLACVLTRDHGHAEDLLQTTLTRAWSAWKRIEGDPEPYVQRVLVNTYSTWWRRRWHGERPTDDLPDRSAGPAPQINVDDRDEVWRALIKLPRQQRAVLFLRYFEDLTEAQIAETLSISQGTVKAHAAKGLANLRLDPSLLADVGVPEPPHGTERLVAVRERITQRRRTRLLGAAAACAVVLALIAGYLAAPHLANRARLMPTELQAPEYFRGHKVVTVAQGTFTGLESVTATWIPTTTSAIVSGQCASPLDVTVEMKIHLNDQSLVGTGCTKAGGFSAWQTIDFTALGLKVGEPVTVSISLTTPRRGAVIPSVGSVMAIVGEAAPFEQVPLPTRPAELKPLERKLNGASPSESTVLEAAGSHSTAILWDRKLMLSGGSQTPGLLHVSVNGVRVMTMDWWDYEQGGWGGDLDPLSAMLKEKTGAGPGTTITITVEAEHMTGDWYLAISPGR